MGTTMSDENCIEIYEFNYDNLTIHYGCKEGKYGKFKIKILDNKTNFIIHQEVMMSPMAFDSGPILGIVKVLYTMR